MSNGNNMPITHPWLIVHQPGGPPNPIETIIAGPGVEQGGGYQGFGLIIADVIRHVARAFDVTEEQVIEWVQKEMDRPTTELTRTGPN